LALFERRIYTNDEIKLIIKRLEREIKELQNQYNTALLRSKEMFSKPHSIKDSMECFSKYGYPRDLKCDINSRKESILIYKNMLLENNNLL
jgi:hypothetical protein